MNPLRSILTALVLLAAGSAKAQHTGHSAAPSAQHPDSRGSAPAAPYAGMETRAIKALSEQQIADLRAGRGMGLALPAELNGYPGPIHVLELGDRLGLTREQRARVEDLHVAMKAETIPLGERLIAQETDLDWQFASKSVTPASLQATTADIGATQGALRGAHLRYHLSTLEALTPEQVRLYDAFRCYGRPSRACHRLN